MDRSKIITALTILAITFSYAIIRYNVLRGTPWEHLPLFISNKAISLSATLALAASYALGSLTRFFPTFVPALSVRKFLGIYGFGLASIHTLISLLIINSATYPRFFAQNGQLNLVGELSLLFGVLAFFSFLLVAIVSIPSIAQSLGKNDWLKVQKIGYLGLTLVLLHVFVMGRQGWFEPETWPGKLLPISLIAAIIITLTLLAKLMAILFPKKQTAQQ